MGPGSGWMPTGAPAPGPIVRLNVHARQGTWAAGPYAFMMTCMTTLCGISVGPTKAKTYHRAAPRPRLLPNMAGERGKGGWAPEKVNKCTGESVGECLSRPA